MEIYILDKDTLDRIGMVDVFESFIWNTSYNGVGSFEIHCSMKYFSLLQTDRIVQNTEDDKHSGVIEYVTKVTKDDGSETLAVKGRMAEALLDRRIALGSYVYEAKQPAHIAAELITANAITTRPIPLLEIGALVDADEGVIDYAGANKQLLSEVQGICQQSFLGFNLRTDDENKKYIFDTYKGVNRTEEANTVSHVETNPITDLLTNGAFESGFDGWNVVNNERAFDYRKQEEFGPYPMTISNGIVSKSRVCSIGDDGNLYDIWEPSPHMYQKVQLSNEHIYYITVKANNPTVSVISCGPGEKTYPINLQKSTGFSKTGALFVPEINSAHNFYMGYGELPEQRDAFMYMEYAALFDLTATFGVGKEPDLNWCNKNIYYYSGWKYKTEVIEFVENQNNPLILSRDRDTLIEVEYTKSIVNECTYIYIKGAGDVSTFVAVGNPEGLEIKEKFLDLSSIPREVDGVTIPLASYTAMLQNNAKATMRQLVVNEIIDGKLYLLSNKKFGRDFYLGDIVGCADDSIGFLVNLRITSATETWDTSGHSVTVTLGDDVPNIYETIKLVSKGAK